MQRHPSVRTESVDSDLAESLQALKAALESRGTAARFRHADAELITDLRARLKLPRRFRDFLAAANPVDVEARTPAETVRLVPAERLLEEQRGFALPPGEGAPSGSPAAGWRGTWIIVGHSAVLGDPYFLDLGAPDAEGDCPVLTAMSGTELWKPRLAASSFALFLRILAAGLETARGFAEDDLDVEDEQVFRDAFAPRLRALDPAAARAGHWT